MHKLTFAGSGDEINIPLLRPVHDDLVSCERLFEDGDTPFFRRTYVRAAFAYLEANLFWLREETRVWLMSPSLLPIEKRSTKIVLLGDGLYVPDENGNLQRRPNKMRFLDMCAFSLRTASECWGLKLPNFTSTPDWEQLKQAVKVRDRLMHPKQIEQLNVSDEELFAVQDALRFFYNKLIEIVNASTTYIAAMENQLPPSDPVV